MPNLDVRIWKGFPDELLYPKNNMKEQLETEKQANFEKIKAEEQAIEEMERIFKHAKFEKAINISRLTKANKEIDKMIQALSV